GTDCRKRFGRRGFRSTHNPRRGDLPRTFDLENRLLKLIGEATKDEDRQQLEEGLVNVRRAKANLEIKISPHQVGAAITPLGSTAAAGTVVGCASAQPRSAQVSDRAENADRRSPAIQ